MKTLPFLLSGAAALLWPASSMGQMYAEFGHSGYHHGGYGWHHPGSRVRVAPRSSLSFGIGIYPSYPSYSYGYPAYGACPSPYIDSIAAEVQRELASRGYYGGSIDGVIGPRSRAAIRAFQADYGLVITGRIDSALLRALRLS